eukprot:CAMPEP_0170245418 /NCGR_PEP_ID=MMETSP0116_2-20130129/22495_1 /TAXON_ID=400756 /ORGANISM="Durinskia baltica, Strain CSIRO CS-38" /LENGTH=174 /DNA_ID=CAMNT_0010496293 /DNA_START=76 /DNA_END=596 /DNA_ORIENTATION=-
MQTVSLPTAGLQPGAMAQLATGMPTSGIQHPGMKQGVQYMCCMVTLDESGRPQAQLPNGSVPIAAAQLPAGQVPTQGASVVPVNLGTGGLPSGAVSISQLGLGQLSNLGGAIQFGPQIPVPGQGPGQPGQQQPMFGSFRGPQHRQAVASGPGPGMMTDQVWGRSQQGRMQGARP